MTAGKPHRREHLVETIGYEKKVYVDGSYVREYLSVSRTKAYEITREFADDTDEDNAIIKFHRCLRVRKDLFEAWVFGHGIRGGTG